MVAYSTSTFRKSLKDVKKKHDSCCVDICNALKDRSISDLSQSNPRIASHGRYSVFKIRVANSKENVGKSGAFRLIAAITNGDDEIFLLYLYPKKGSIGQENIPKNVIKELVSIFIQERDELSLVQMDLGEELAEIAS